MKKALCLILVVLTCLSLCACGGKDVSKKAYKDSKEAFDYITTAYLAINEFSKDIYEAWRIGVNERKDYDDESDLDDFAGEMYIDLASIKQAVANLNHNETYEYGDWEFLPFLYNSSYFSAWVSVISEAYKCSGDVDEIKGYLETAKSLMKDLGDEYSDYEHYPALKKYFTNTVAFFNFCCEPEGSFEQVVETFNAYRNNAREYFFEMNYVFSDSIGGLEDYVIVVGEDATEENEENTGDEATTEEAADATKEAATAAAD